jgi:hypothetical protein
VNTTEAESRMIERLRREQLHWPMVRMLGLISGISALFISIRSLLEVGNDAGTLSLFAITFYVFSYTMTNWAGRPETALLLKLLDSQSHVGTPTPSNVARSERP